MDLKIVPAGAVQNEDFLQRWAGLMQTEFGTADLFADAAAGQHMGHFSDQELIDIGRRTRQFRY